MWLKVSPGVRTKAPRGEPEVDETVGEEASGAFVSGLALTSGAGHAHAR